MGKISWRWKGREIEEVKEIKYLGYTLQRNGGQEGAQIKDRVARGAAILGQVWGIGRMRFRGDWKRRMWLFDKLVWTVMSYGVEIWRWKERKRMERLQERYLRWILGVEGRTPGYLIREEVKREKLRIRARKRAWKFEERLLGGGGASWQECASWNRGYDEKGKRINRLDERKRKIFGRKGSEMEGLGKTRGERWFRRSGEEEQREG